MGENSKIEWTDHTFNPWIGCQEVSPACDNCYARVQNNHRKWVKGWGPHGERKRTKTWRDPIKFDKAAEDDGVRRKIFCASLADVFDNKVPQEWRDDLWDLIAATSNLDWLLLTKRPQNMVEMLPSNWRNGWKNVWLGTTTENQDEYWKRRSHLFSVPAVVHFISYEPALGALDIQGPAVPDWVICGGESAKGIHRPMDIKWARDLRDQCARLDVAFFMKQIDKKQPIPGDLMVREFPLAMTRPSDRESERG